MTTSKDKVDKNMENEILKETVGMIVDAFGSDLEMITIERAVFGLSSPGSKSLPGTEACAIRR